MWICVKSKTIWHDKYGFREVDKGGRGRYIEEKAKNNLDFGGGNLG